MEAIQKAHPILYTLLKIQRKYEKDYSFPSQLKILELLVSRQKLKKSIATLNRWLRVTEDDKYLIRRRRIRREKNYGTIFKSTLYKLTIKGYWLLHRMGVDVRDEIRIYEKWRESIKPKRKKTTFSRKREGGLTPVGDIGIIRELLEPGG